MRRVKRLITQVIILAVGGFASVSAYALSCDDELKFHHEIINARLASTPGLRKIILEMTRDPLIAGGIKRILRDALVKEDLEVRHLTEQLRVEMKVPKELDAVALSRGLGFRIVNMNPPRVHDAAKTERTVNQSATETMDLSTIKARRTVLIQDRPVSTKTNDVISLVHELAHIRMDRFLERTFFRLLKKLPRDILRFASDGIIEVDRSFFDFISERYAVQTEYELVVSMYGRYFTESYYRFPPTINETNYKAQIAEYVIRAYKIQDPRILALKNVSISDILLGRF